ncbi:MAG: hypothetical protein EOM12_12350 [Verrucomicrobiae bacterium]|nr:hypothetical protein [Verrucomicrobiae bacterium]
MLRALIAWKRLSIVLLICVYFFDGDANISHAHSWGKHVSDTNIYVSGFTTSELKEIHSAIIDTVPWKPYTGGSINHRDLWGHTSDWYFHGKLPEDLVISDLMESREISQREASRIFREEYANLPSGRDIIARRIMEWRPSLSLSEARALADQVQASHILGDATTPYGKNLSPDQVQWAQKIVHNPPLNALKAMTKVSLENALKANLNLPTASFINQHQHYRLLRALDFCEKYGVHAYNPDFKGYVGVRIDGKGYVVGMTASDAEAIIKRGYNVIVPDDEYEKLLRKNPSAASKALPESAITKQKTTLAENKSQATNRVDELIVAQKQSVDQQKRSFAAAAKDSLKRVAPYLISGALLSVIENWGYIRMGMDREVDWGDVFTRVGTDFVGYSATPAIVQGTLVLIAGKESALILHAEKAGVQFLAGIFIYGTGKEVFGWYKGELTYEEMKDNIKGRASRAAWGAAMVPVAVVVGKVSSMIVPVAIIVGPYIFQRGKEWYEEKQWEKILFVEDIEAMMGKDLMSSFSLLLPESAASLLQPEKTASIVSPQHSSSILEPERGPSLLTRERSF